MVAVKDRAELLERELLRLAERHGQVPRHVRFEPVQFGSREGWVQRDVGHERGELRTEVAQYFPADAGGVTAHADAERPTHPRRVARQLRPGLARRPLPHQVAGQVREPGLGRVLEGVAGADDQRHADLRDVAPLDQRDLEAVVEREAFGFGDAEILRRPRLRRLGREGVLGVRGGHAEQHHRGEQRALDDGAGHLSCPSLSASPSARSGSSAAGTRAPSSGSAPA